MNGIKKYGFVDVEVQKEKKITIPKDGLSLYLNESEPQRYQSGEIGIYSVTVYGEKPVSKPNHIVALNVAIKFRYGTNL